MSVEPAEGIVMPGASAVVHLTVEVDALSAAALNTGAQTLDDILILHLENGKDYFVSVAGAFQRTCFATPLDDLVHASRPLRSEPLAPLVRLGGAAAAGAAVRHPSKGPA